MLTIENIKPSFPAFSAVLAFIPKPKPTTEICNSLEINVFVVNSYGFPTSKAITNPNIKAIGADMKGVKQRMANPIKSTF